MNAASIGYGVQVCPGCEVKGCVPKDFIEEMKSAGFNKPVLSFMDPRLSYPEIFLQHGWQRQNIAEGAMYSQKSGKIEQKVEFGQGRWRRVTTTLADRSHVVEMMPDGRVRQWVESKALPKLDQQLDSTRAQFDAFVESGTLDSGEHQFLSPTQVEEYVEQLRSELGTLKGFDESCADQAQGLRGEVALEDGSQSRYWQTPCGWELSSYDPQEGLQIAYEGFGKLWSFETDQQGAATALYIDMESPENSFIAVR